MAKAYMKLLCITFLVSNAVALCQNKENGQRIAHPLDCNRFITCLDGNAASIGMCPAGLHFNRRLGECDLKTRAGCKGLEFWAAPNTCDTSSCCACCDCSGCPTCDNDLDVCQGQPDNTKLQYPGDCSKFVTCENNCAIIGECPCGQLWNPQTKCCDTPCNVDCPGSGYPCQTCSNNITVCEGKPNGSFEPCLDDCTQYYSCQNNCATVQVCGTNTLWNSTTNQCEDACSVSCKNNPYTCDRSCPEGLTVCDGKPAGSLQAVPDDCSVYVVCNDQCTIKECPEGELYNPSSEKCEIACNVDCPGSGYPCNSPTPTPTSTPTPTPTPKPTSRPVGVGPSGIACDTSGICENMPDGTLFKDQNTNGYIVCQCECEIPRPCPTGLIFNDNLKTCDWPAQPDGSSVNCPPGLVFNSAVGVCDWPKTQ